MPWPSMTSMKWFIKPSMLPYVLLLAGRTGALFGRHDLLVHRILQAIEVWRKLNQSLLDAACLPHLGAVHHVARFDDACRSHPR